MQNNVNRKIVKREINIWVDEYRGFYKYRSLDSHNVKYLSHKGYKLKKFKNVQGKTEKYLLKPIGNESLQHCFYVWDIFLYIKRLTNKVEMFHSAKPDIIFETTNGNTYAIEVETGKSYKNSIKKLKEKVRLLKREYGDRWFFFVTNRNLVKKYKKLGKTYEKRNIVDKLYKLFCLG